MLAGVTLVACGGGGTTTPPSTSAAPSTTRAALVGDEHSELCGLLAEVDLSTVLTGDSTDPAAVRAAFESLVEVLRTAHAVAPAEIEADLALVRSGIEALDAAVRAVDYDLDALAASGRSALVTKALEDPVFTDAGARLGRYRTEVCHL